VCQSRLRTEILVVTNEDPLVASGGEERLELGEGREVLVNLTLSNTGDPAYFAWVTLNFRQAEPSSSQLARLSYA
jgi:hypothetical protein